MEENINEEAIKTVVVLGMHRSGTSMVAGILSILGVHMGERLVGESWSNPLGHFESRDFLRINNEILKSAGGTWQVPPKQENILFQNERFSEEIKNLVEKSDSGLWGWKDPRTSLTIELYLPYIKNPYFIICYREPYKIGQSLLRRDGTSIAEGIRICEIYNRRISDFLEKHPNFKKLELSYERIIKDPEREIGKIVSFLEIKPNETRLNEALRFVLSPRKKKGLSFLMRERDRLKKACVSCKLKIRRFFN